MNILWLLCTFFFDLDCYAHLNTKNSEKSTHQSNFESISKENVDSIGVIASSAVWNTMYNKVTLQKIEQWGQRTLYLTHTHK